MENNLNRFLKLQSHIGGKDYIRLSALINGGCVDRLPVGFILQPPFAAFLEDENELYWNGWEKNVRKLHDYPVTETGPRCKASFYPLSHTQHPRSADRVTFLRREVPQILSSEALFACEENCDPIWVFDTDGVEIGSGILFHASMGGYVICSGVLHHKQLPIAAPVNDYGKTWIGVHWANADCQLKGGGLFDH